MLRAGFRWLQQILNPTQQTLSPIGQTLVPHLPFQRDTSALHHRSGLASNSTACTPNPKPKTLNAHCFGSALTTFLVALNVKILTKDSQGIVGGSALRALCTDALSAPPPGALKQTAGDLLQRMPRRCCCCCSGEMLCCSSLTSEGCCCSWETGKNNKEKTEKWGESHILVAKARQITAKWPIRHRKYLDKQKPSRHRREEVIPLNMCVLFVLFLFSNIYFSCLGQLTAFSAMTSKASAASWAATIYDMYWWSCSLTASALFPSTIALYVKSVSKLQLWPMLIAVSNLSPVKTHTLTPAAFKSAIVSTTSSCSLQENPKPHAANPKP